MKVKKTDIPSPFCMLLIGAGALFLAVGIGAMLIIQWVMP